MPRSKKFSPSPDYFYPQLGFALIEEKYTSFETAKFVILPIPYDGVTSYKPGTREGPSAIVSASQFVELYDQETGLEAYKAGIYTLPEMIPVVGNAEAMQEHICKVCKDLIKRKKFVVGLGGDHSVSYGLIKAHLEKYHPLTILQFDAHPDLRDEYEGTRLSSATVMRRSMEMGAKVVQVGVRAISKDDMQYAKKHGIKQYLAEDIVGSESLNWTDKMADDLQGNIYITFDIDFFDSSIMPATGTPEPGGPDWYTAVKLLKKVTQQKKVIGFDVVELSPDLGPHACSFLAAKLTYKLMGYIISGKQ